MGLWESKINIDISSPKIIYKHICMFIDMSTNACNVSSVWQKRKQRRWFEELAKMQDMMSKLAAGLDGEEGGDEGLGIMEQMMEHLLAKDVYVINALLFFLLFLVCF